MLHQLLRLLAHGLCAARRPRRARPARRDTAAPRAGKVLDPNWGSLYKEFAGDEEKLIAQVDCQHDGASLCEKYQVDSLPTLMFGAADELQVYDRAAKG